MSLMIHSDATLLAREGPAEDVDLRAAEARFGRLPAEYVGLVKEATEIELRFQNGRYLRIWGPLGCIEMDDGYDIGRRIPGAIPIGDDGGGDFLYYGSGGQGVGLYRCSYGNIDANDATWIGGSLEDLLARQVGMEHLR